MINKYLIVLFLIMLTACAQVPKEVVELSYYMGEDIKSLHISYKKLVHQRFDDFRKERLRYVEERWKPDFLHRWVKNAKLVEVAKGDLVWSDKADDFVPPDPDSAIAEAQRLDTIDTWAREAIRKIEEKKASLIEPLNKQEESVLQEINVAFNNVMHANAHITAHLNSLREVQEVQDEALSALNLKDLRSKIDSAISDMNVNAEKGLDAIKKVDGFIDKASDKF